MINSGCEKKHLQVSLISLDDVTDIIMERKKGNEDILIFYLTSDPNIFKKLQVNNEGFLTFYSEFNLNENSQRVIEFQGGLEIANDYFRVINKRHNIITMTNGELRKISDDDEGELDGEYLDYTSNDTSNFDEIYTSGKLKNYYKDLGITVHTISSSFGKKNTNRINKYDSLFDGTL